jgi:hypothetical protein
LSYDICLSLIWASITWVLEVNPSFKTYLFYYQQSGDAKTLYFAQYSADVSEDTPVRVS